QDVSCLHESIDDIDRLIFVRQCSFKISRHHCHPFCMTSFGHFNGFIAVPGHSIDPFLFACSQRSFPMPVIRSDHKNSHRHPQFCKKVTYLLLLFNGSLHHIIIFNGTETIVISKFYLVKKIAAGIIFKHAFMRRVVTMESLFIGLIFLVILCRKNSWGKNTASCKNSILNKIFAIHGFSLGSIYLKLKLVVFSPGINQSQSEIFYSPSQEISWQNQALLIATQ